MQVARFFWFLSSMSFKTKMAGNSNSHNFFLEAQNNPYTDLNVRHHYLHLIHFQMLTRPLLIAKHGWIEIDLQIRTNSYSATLNLQRSTHSFLFLPFFWMFWESASYRIVPKKKRNNYYCFNFSFWWTAPISNIVK